MEEKHKENVFLSKFHMLNSQENNEEINWSSSDSSDYEMSKVNQNTFSRATQNENRKRKRKKTVSNNISNLNVTIVDVNKDSSINKSPILTRKHDVKKVCVSPILTSSVAPKNSLANSPILNARNRSPILHSKNSPNVKKKLFKSVTTCEDSFNCNLKLSNHKVTKEYYHHEIPNINESGINILTQQGGLDSESNHKAQIDLVNKVKSFFDSHFSSESASQNSISDSATPKESSKTSDDLEILSCKTQFIPKNVIKQEDLTSISSSNEYTELFKKVKYKKDGLAHRLNYLLKKQTANISLWQHERYLAENSSFVIPKEEYVVFRIQKVHFKYGCYLIEATNIDNDTYLILINNCNVNNNIKCDMILKLYAPYKIIDKLIINVYKFQCLPMKK